MGQRYSNASLRCLKQRLSSNSSQSTCQPNSDKESPLWNVHSQVIYWRTAAEIDDKNGHCQLKRRLREMATSSLRILIKGLLRSLLIIEFNLASTQALACSDGILDTVGVFARRSFVMRVSNTSLLGAQESKPQICGRDQKRTMENVPQTSPS